MKYDDNVTVYLPNNTRQLIILISTYRMCIDQLLRYKREKNKLFNTKRP